MDSYRLSHVLCFNSEPLILWANNKGSIKGAIIDFQPTKPNVVAFSFTEYNFQFF